MTKEENLLRIAEEVAYSSKGHYKSADWVSLSIKICIMFPIIISVALLTWQTLPVDLSRFLNCTALVFSLIALMSPVLNNQDKTAETIKNHMELGNGYLEIYKDIRILLTQGTVSDSDMNGIMDRVRSLDHKTSQFRIGFVARIWSKWRIESEMDLSWTKK